MQINRNKTQVYGGKGLELIKPAHEPVFSRPRSRASQKNAPGKLPMNSPLIDEPRRKEKGQLFPQKPPKSRAFISCTGIQLSPGSSTIELPLTLVDLVLTRPIERANIRLHLQE